MKAEGGFWTAIIAAELDVTICDFQIRRFAATNRGPKVQLRTPQAAAYRAILHAKIPAHH